MTGKVKRQDLTAYLYGFTERCGRGPKRLLSELQKKGYDKVRIEGDPGNDLVDVCRLTCLEEGIRVASSVGGKGQEDELPVLRVDDRGSRAIPSN